MIDLSSGELILHEEDFHLPGIIPITCKRNYFSHIERNTCIGKHWHLNQEQYITLDVTQEYFQWQNCSGNIVEMPYISIGDEAVITDIKIIYKHLGDTILIENYEKGLLYEFKKLHKNSQKHLLIATRKHRFKINYYYDHKDRLIKIVDSCERHLFFDREDHLITHIYLKDQKTQEEKTLVRYQYDDDGRLNTVLDALHQAEKYSYAGGSLVEKTDRNNHQQFWKHQKGKEHSQYIARWNTHKKNYESFAYHQNKTIVTNSYGHATTHQFENGNTIAITDPKGNTEYWEYNVDDQVIRYTDVFNNSTYYGYDEYGHQTSIQLPNGAKTQYAYKNNHLVMAKDARDALWIWEYDEQGFLQSRIGHNNDITRYEYTDELLTHIIDANGETTQLYYTDDYQLEKVVLPNGQITQWQYDGQGQLLHAVANQQTSTGYQYDAIGRVTAIKTTDGNQIHLTYDGIGNVITAKDTHHTVAFAYSPTGRLLSRKENDTKIKFAYNQTDQLVAITNEHKNLYQFKRDALGAIVEENGFDGLIRTYDRDAGGRVAQVHTPDGTSTRYQYDVIGNIQRIIHHDDSQEVYNYDRMGALISATNPNGTVTIQRDDLGRVIQETQNEIEVHSTYNRLGQRTQVTSNLGAHVQLTHNKYGELTETQAAQGESKWEIAFKRNLLGQEIERSITGGIVSTWERDITGKPKVHSISVNERVTAKRNYHWDVNDRLQGIYDHIAGSMTRFEHDLFGNLASANYQDGSWDFKFPDAVGNLFKSKEQNDRTYGKAGQLLKDETYKYSYDSLGNLIRKESLTETWEYHWTQNGMLKAVKRPDHQWVRFTYDALGRRLSKTYKDNTTHYAWDGNVLLHEWKLSKNETLAHVDEHGALQFDIPENLITWIFEEGSFIPMAKLQGGNSYSILSDHLGTPQEVYDQEGKKVWQCQLDIYGKPRILQGDQTFIPFRYQGQYEDVETGLYYNRFRYYAPDEGIYISQDPIGLAGGMPNMYAYVEDNNKWIDPFGQSGIAILNQYSNGNGDFHYSVTYEGIETDLSKSRRTNKINIRKGSNLELKGFTLIDSVEVQIKKKGKGARTAINGAKTIFQGEEYLFRKFDCFTYAETILNRLGSGITSSGIDNEARFDSLKKACS